MITIKRPEKRQTGSSIASSDGGWSMATPPTKKVNIERLNEELQGLKSAPPLMNTTAPNVSIGVSVSPEVGAVGTDSAECNDNDVEMDSRVLTSDDDENANDDTSLKMAETESRVYDTQDDTGMSEEESANVEVEWTADRVADFIMAENEDLIEYANLIRNERIGGNLIPYLSQMNVKDYVISSLGDHLRFLRLVDKLKKTIQSPAKHVKQIAADTE